MNLHSFLKRSREDPDSVFKDDELEALFTFAHGLGDGLYLKSLFSEAMLAWVEKRVREDVAPDLHEWCMQGDEQLREAQAAAKAENDALKREIDRLNAEAEEWERSLANEQERRDDEQARIKQLHDDNVRAWDRLAAHRGFVADVMGTATNAWIQMKAVTPEQIRDAADVLGDRLDALDEIKRVDLGDPACDQGEIGSWK